MVDTRQLMIFCTSCGHRIEAGARFCANCGKQLDTAAAQFNPAPLSYAGTPATAAPTSEEKQYALFCHLATFLGWIIPFADLIAVLVIWLSKRDTSDFIDDQGKEALNFQINIFFWFFVFGVLSCAWIGIPFLFLLLIFEMIFPIIAAVQASEGKRYRYPAILRIIR